MEDDWTRTEYIWRMPTIPELHCSLEAGTFGGSNGARIILFFVPIELNCLTHIIVLFVLFLGILVARLSGGCSSSSADQNLEGNGAYKQL